MSTARGEIVRAIPSEDAEFRIRTTAVDAGGLSLAVRSCGRGPLVLLLHGFPDTAETWDAVLPVLANAGYRAVAIHLRGYAPSDLARDGDYSVSALARDAAAVADALGADRFGIIGHDWGAAAAWAASTQWPQRIAFAVGIAIAPARYVRSGLRECLARPHNVYLGWAGIARWWVGRRDLAYVDAIYRKWSPGWRPAPDHLERVKGALRPRERLNAALAYYRTAHGARPARVENRNPIAVPALAVLGGDEPASRHRMFASFRAEARSNQHVHVYDGVGHWPHLEAPARFETDLLDFLEERARDRPFENADLEE